MSTASARPAASSENDPDKEKTNYAVALESGFRSESVFYVNFKKLVGTTPVKYRKSCMMQGALVVE